MRSGRWNPFSETRSSDRVKSNVAVVPSLANQAARGVLVTMSGQALRIAVQVLSVAILARLLSPADYGLLAMVAAVIGVADIFRDFGLSTAAIQARTLSKSQRNNLFWINTSIGLLLSILVWISAPLIATLYQQPSLVPIAQSLAWTFLLNGIATQYRADLNRSLRFTLLATADVAGPVVALGVAAGLAAGGAGYWALVAQQLVQFAVMLVIVVAGARWLPGRPSRATSMDGMLRFGWNIVATQLIGYVSSNADSVIIGLRYGADPLGQYNRAFQLLMNPLNQVRAPVTRIAIPILASLQDDEKRYSAFLLRGQSALGHSLGFVLGAGAGACVPLTAVFLGAGEWSGVAPILSLLAISGIFQMLAFVGYWVYVTRGLTRNLVQYSVVSSVVKVLLVLLGSQWGVIGVAAGYALAPALTWPLSFWWLSRCTPVPVRSLYGGALRIVIMSFVAAATSWVVATALADVPALMALLSAVGAALIICACFALVIPPIRRDAQEILDVARRMLRPTRRGHGKGGSSRDDEKSSKDGKGSL
ncbi:lipopolysaccharide biosynthesis protein [Arthrobacter sp. UYCu723]